jgi:hypothetical protein
VLDLGCGDGAALVRALAHAQARPARLDLVEPSAPLLDAAVRALSALGQPSTPHAVTAQDFTAALQPAQRWDVAESTFALHALPYDERTAVLSRLHAHVDELVVVEFDVPDHDPDSDERLAFLADSYEQGLAEYTEDRDLVASGFLMPVLVGQLAPGAARVTYEQPSAAWEEQLRSCGYSDVEATRPVPLLVLAGVRRHRRRRGGPERSLDVVIASPVPAITRPLLSSGRCPRRRARRERLPVLGRITPFAVARRAALRRSCSGRVTDRSCE